MNNENEQDKCVRCGAPREKGALASMCPKCYAKYTAEFKAEKEEKLRQQVACSHEHVGSTFHDGVTGDEDVFCRDCGKWMGKAKNYGYGE